MALTKAEIANIRFEQVKKGYSIEQVDAFLGRVADEFERQNLEIAAVAEANERYRKMESDLTRALVSAESTAKRVMEDANEKARTILDEANAAAVKTRIRAEAEELGYREKCESERDELIRQTEELKHFFDKYREALLSSAEAFRASVMQNFEDQSWDERPASMKPVEEEIFTVQPSPAVEEEKEVKKPISSDVNIPSSGSIGSTAKSTGTASTGGFDLSAILRDLPETDKELKAIIDELI